MSSSSSPTFAKLNGTNYPTCAGEMEAWLHSAGLWRIDNPVKMWTALESVHLQKKPGAHFNAYGDLFSIRKEDNESLQSLMNRVETAITKIKDLHPKDFTLDSLDSELASMTLIRALPEEYNSFVSSLLLKDNLDKDTIKQSFVTEEIQCSRRARDASTASGSALKASTTTTTTNCDFCGLRNHITTRCRKYMLKIVMIHY
ncbi:hypothetical protein AMATHDRAFT_164154 [Amanita thiersii Skay4041]|uniref:Uncharacterized protein n=1 Tax=Amanita thiersii Skay4041 TaxID=703135 RepID=A0A2A9NBA4_9AGAR|nr:hypothetical protein AMATHDRAFT_164154 [Amanita thiersii Skay4041]